MRVNMDLRRFGNAKDQKEEFLTAIKPFLPKIKLIRNRLLIGTYVFPTKSKGGIEFSDQTITEMSRYQGKVGLILKLGPRAFCWDETSPEMDPDAPQPGEWVFYRPSDTWECGIGPGIPCRFIFDSDVVGSVIDPTAVW